jgi:hypothetical protein
MCFKLLYWLYLTPIGRFMHAREINAITKAHLKWKVDEMVPTFKVGRLVVLPVPYLADNLAYVIYSENTVKGTLQLELLVDPGDF